MPVRPEDHGARPHSPGLPWQFVFRATLIVTGLTLLLIVNVRGALFYVAWSLIVLALVSEAAATAIHRRRTHRNGG